MDRIRPGLIGLMLLPLAFPAGAADDPPFGAEPPMDSYLFLLDAFQERFGRIPPTALFDGRSVSATAALHLLRDNPGSLMGQDDTYEWDEDTGIGNRGEGNECIVSAFIAAVSLTATPQDPIGRRTMQGLPNPLDAGPTLGSTILCGTTIPYVQGEIGGEIPPGTLRTLACVFVGVWTNPVSLYNCHVNDFAAANLIGHVGHYWASFCDARGCLNMGVMFGGVAHWNPAYLAYDPVVVGLEA